MTTDPFTEAARAEAEKRHQGDWDPFEQEPVEDWGFAKAERRAFVTGAEWARTHLAAPTPPTPNDVRRALDVAVESFNSSRPPIDEPYTAWKVRQAAWEALRELFPDAPQSAQARPEGAYELER